MFNMRVMTIHVACYSIFGLTVLTLMVLVTKKAFTAANYSNLTDAFIAANVLVFISNIILLHIFNNLVNKEIVMATWENDSVDSLGDGSVLSEDDEDQD